MAHTEKYNNKTWVNIIIKLLAVVIQNNDKLL